jgi:hypothetical protein
MDVTESQALWSLAFVLLVLRWQPPMGWLGRSGRWTGRSAFSTPAQ